MSEIYNIAVSSDTIKRKAPDIIFGLVVSDNHELFSPPGNSTDMSQFLVVSTARMDLNILLLSHFFIVAMPWLAHE